MSYREDEIKLRKELESKYGKVYNTGELQEYFKVTAFSSPYVIVTRLSDNVVGSLQFTHMPRLYYNFKED